MLEDIAILTGGQVVSEEVGLKLENVGLECSARRAGWWSPRTRRRSSTAAATQDAINDRIRQLKRK